MIRHRTSFRQDEHNRNADIVSRIRAQAEGSVIVDGYDPFKDRKRDVKEKYLHSRKIEYAIAR